MAVRTNFKAVLEKVRKAVVEEPISPEQMKKMGEEAVRKIQVRTRLGYGVEKPGGPRKKLPPLREGYIESRSKSKKLSSFTNPRRSNLTFTGQLLESLKMVVRRGNVSIEPTGARDDGLSNQTVAGYVTEARRAFISLSNLEIKALARYWQKDILGKVLRKRGLT